tara:strand:- start:98 stop:493 length:396 start_codon:yes stop_codon:yes gene_type:complete
MIKKTLLIACLFVGLNTVAQNHLEFNQVVTIDSSYTIPYVSNQYYYDGEYYYVPPGKAWKVESFSSNGYFQINDVKLIGRVLGSNAGVDPISFPIWLKSGDKINYANYFHNGGNNVPIEFFISALEFNIVQ